MSLPAVSKHLKVLERAGLIARGPRGPVGAPCRIEPEAFKEVDNLARGLPPPLGGSAFDRLDAFLKRLQAKDTSKEPKNGRKKPRNQKRAVRDGHVSASTSKAIPRSSPARAPSMLRAPHYRVSRAWTRPEHLARWWGPDGFSITMALIRIPQGAACGASSCTAPTDATTRTASRSTRSCHRSAIAYHHRRPATMSSRWNSARSSPSRIWATGRGSRCAGRSPRPAEPKHRVNQRLRRPTRGWNRRSADSPHTTESFAEARWARPKQESQS